MKIWPVQDAKAKFSELLKTCKAEGPQMVSNRGVVEAVLVPVEQWEARKGEHKLTIKEWLLMDKPRFDLDIPPRGRARRRQPVDF